MARQLVMVIGPDQDATAALASVLGKLGYSIPEPEWLADFHKGLLNKSLVENSDARPSAFSDILSLLAEHDEHRIAAKTWLGDQFAHSDFVLLQDPSQLWFTTLWDSVADELCATTTYLTALREPCNVIDRKEDWSEPHTMATDAAAGWINTMLYSERATRDRPRGFCKVSEFLTDWVGVVSRLDEDANLPPVRSASARLYRSADALVDPSLRPSTTTWEELGVSPSLSTLADKIYTQYSKLVRPDSSPQNFDNKFDTLRSEYRELYEWAEAVSQSTAKAAKRTGVRQGRRRERRRLNKNPPASK